MAKPANRAQGIPAPLTRFVRRIEAEVYLRQEVADALGVSVARVGRAVKAVPALGPSFMTRWGKREILLYTPADREAIRAHLAANRPRAKDGRVIITGTPALWTAQERKDRQSRRCQVRYLHTAAGESEQAGLGEVAADHLTRARVIQDHLDAERAARIAARTHPSRHRPASWTATSRIPHR